MTRSVVLVIICLMACSSLAATGYVIDEIIDLKAGTSDYDLSQSNIIIHSETVYSDSLQLLPGIDYRLDYQNGRLHLLKVPPAASLKLSYLIVPGQFTKRIQVYERIAFSDSIAVLDRPRSAQWLTSGTNLKISGSKTFALSLSESGETDLLQSLYVNLNGELAKDIFITAQLSDSQSKLSPEGDSKELSSLDQVFIRVYGPRWELGMGDLDFAFDDSRFLSYQTKLEGIAFDWDGKHQAQAAFSAGGGKRAQMQIEIIDGKQGPYYLTAHDAQRSFIIVAGTEEIYLDGNRLERGTDYYIDYAEGSVLFRRLVSSTNTVNAWFQYSDENYSQSTVFTGSRFHFSDQLSLYHHLVHQTDNKGRPLLFSFTDADLDSLAQAGDQTALSDGVFETEVGDYRQVIDPDGLIYYEYAPGDSTAIYNVVFSYMGPGEGDYEEYSYGRYRWVGPGSGSWLPVKKLIAPARRSNLELGLLWQNDHWQSGIDALYSANDQNTLSKLDDEDNSSGIFSFWLAHAAEESPWQARLDAKYRLSDIYRFGTDGAPEHDFTSLFLPDSLAMGNLDLELGYKGKFWKPQLLLRYRDVKDEYIQKAFRFRSESHAYSLFPALRLQHTVSQQIGSQNSLLQYHDAEAAWAYHILGLRISGLYSSIEDDDPSLPGTRFLRWKPTLSLTGIRQNTALSFAQEQSDLKLESWDTQNRAETYSLKHNSNFEKHRFDLDYNHRNIQNPHSDSKPKSSYDLLILRSGHNVLKGGINLYNNYELNQTEFFPRIRDLVHVGSSLGIYDSTGVLTDDGEYVYEYVTSPTGRLSTEITAMSSIYLKPGLLWDNPFWKRIQSDISVSATEQGDVMDDWRSYLFLPEHSYNNQSIYGRQSYLQNFWLDLYQSRIIGNLSVDLLRSLDNRYQTPERLFENRQQLQVDFRGYLKMNTRLGFENEFSRESRYSSEISIQSVSGNFEKVISPQNTFILELAGSREEGSRQDGQETYSLSSLKVTPQVRSLLMQKYRISGRFSLGYQFREGSDYLLFLPQKREGLITDGTLSAIYRMNAFSTFSLEYRLSKYPNDKSKHNLKLEFKAEL